MTNFTKDWNDGTTIAALVDAMAPGLCPEYAIMNPENALENATQAMKLAEEWLGIPQASVASYIVAFHRAILQRIACWLREDVRFYVQATNSGYL